MWLAGSIEIYSQGFLWQYLSIQDASPQLEVVTFSKELLELRWIDQFKWVLAQGPLLHPHNQKAQDRVCLLILAPIISCHAGDLQTIPYWVQDVQSAAVCLNGAHGAFKGGLLHSSHCCCSDSVVCAPYFGHTSWLGHL